MPVTRAATVDDAAAIARIYTQDLHTGGSPTP
jgi:hypothetical protein